VLNNEHKRKWIRHQYFLCLPVLPYTSGQSIKTVGRIPTFWIAKQKEQFCEYPLF
jgi:hypothetical protein